MQREYEVNDVVKCRSQGQFYDAKIIAINESQGSKQYRVHFIGWNSRHDQWKEANDLRPKVALPRPFTNIFPKRVEEKNGEKPTTEKNIHHSPPSLFPSHPTPSPSSSLGDSPSSSQSARVEWTMRRGEPFYSPSSMDSGPSSVLSLKKAVISPMSQELISKMASSRISTTMTKENGANQKRDNGNHSLSDPGKDHEAILNSLIKRKHNGNDETINKRKVVEWVCDKQKPSSNHEQIQQSSGEESNSGGPSSLQSCADELSPAQIVFDVSKPPETREQINGKTKNKPSPKISELKSPSSQASSSTMKSPKKSRKETPSTSSFEVSTLSKDVELNKIIRDKSESTIFEIRKDEESRTRRDGAVSPTDSILSLFDNSNIPPMASNNNDKTDMASIFQDLKSSVKKYETCSISQENQRRINNQTFDNRAEEGDLWRDFMPVESFNWAPETPQSSTSSLASLPDRITSFTPETVNNAVIADYSGQLSARPEMMTPYLQAVWSPVEHAEQGYGSLPIGLDQVPAGMILEEVVMESMDPMDSQQAMIVDEPTIDFIQPQTQIIQSRLPPGVHPSQVSLGPGMCIAVDPQGQHYVLSDPIPPTTVRKIIPTSASSSTDHPFIHPSVSSSVDRPSVSSSVDRPSSRPSTSMSTDQQQRVLSREDHSYGLITPNRSESRVFSVVNGVEGHIRPMKRVIQPVRPVQQVKSISNPPFIQNSTPINQEIDHFYQTLPRKQIYSRSVYLVMPPQSPQLQHNYQPVNLAYPTQGVDPARYYQRSQPIDHQPQLVNGNRSNNGMASLISRGPRLSTKIQPSSDYGTPDFETNLVPVGPYHQQEMFDQGTMPGPSNQMSTDHD